MFCDNSSNGLTGSVGSLWTSLIKMLYLYFHQPQMEISSIDADSTPTYYSSISSFCDLVTKRNPIFPIILQLLQTLYFIGVDPLYNYRPITRSYIIS